MGLLSLGLSMLAPKIGSEIVEQGASRVIAKAGANRLTSFIAGKEGQALVTKVAGSRVAGALATERGQMITRYAAKSKIGHTIRGTGGYGSGGTRTTTVNPNVPTPTYGNLASPTSGNAFLSNRAQATQRGQGNSQSAGFGGTGKGWYQLNEQVTGELANRDPASMNDYSVARGPTRYAMAGAGAGTRMLGQIGAGVRDAIAMGPEDKVKITQRRGESPSNEAAPKVSFPKGQVGTNPEAAEQGPIRRAKVVKNRSGPETEHNSRSSPTPGSDVETVPFGGTYRGMGQQVGTSTTPGAPRLESFGAGSAALPSAPLALGPGSSASSTTGPLALNPGPGPKPYTGGMGGNYMDEVYGGGSGEDSEHMRWAKAAGERVAFATNPANKIPLVDQRLAGTERHESQMAKYNTAWAKTGTSIPSVHGDKPLEY